MLQPFIYLVPYNRYTIVTSRRRLYCSKMASCSCLNFTLLLFVKCVIGTQVWAALRVKLSSQYRCFSCLGCLPEDGLLGSRATNHNVFEWDLIIATEFMCCTQPHAIALAQIPSVEQLIAVAQVHQLDQARSHMSSSLSEKPETSGLQSVLLSYQRRRSATRKINRH